MADMSAEEKFALITDRLQEVLSPEIIKERLEKNEPVRIYLGTATTGKPHCGYFVPMLKIGEFLKAGCAVTILLADVHGFLDNLKAPIELIEHRAAYYRFVIIEVLKALHIDISRLRFVLGSDYQLLGQDKKTGNYFFDLLRLSTSVSGHDATKAGSEVVKQVDNAPLASQIYPLMQALDEEYLGVDAQFGGVDQRKIFTLAAETLPRIGYRKRAHLMNPLIPGLQEGGKMSSSDPNSKIDFLDSEKDVTTKVKKAFCPPKQLEGNGVLSFIEHAVLPASALRSPDGKASFVVERRDAEPLTYTNIDDLRRDYEADTIAPQSVKPAMTKALLELLRPIREAFESNAEWREVEQKAYPPPPPPPKKEKKKKDLGSRFPGAKPGDGAEVEAKPDGHLEGAGAQKASVGDNVQEAMEKLEVAKEKVIGAS